MITYHREFEKRKFLAKQRELCVGKSFHQFTMAHSMPIGLVKEFFGDCHEMDILIRGNQVYLSMKKPSAQ